MNQPVQLISNASKTRAWFHLIRILFHLQGFSAVLLGKDGKMRENSLDFNQRHYGSGCEWQKSSHLKSRTFHYFSVWAKSRICFFGTSKASIALRFSATSFNLFLSFSWNKLCPPFFFPASTTTYHNYKKKKLSVLNLWRKLLEIVCSGISKIQEASDNVHLSIRSWICNCSAFW